MIKSAAEIDKQKEQSLQAVIKWLGSRSRLAKILGVTPQAVYEMVVRGQISREGAEILHDQDIEGFKKHTLRPDLWNEDGK